MTDGIIAAALAAEQARLAALPGARPSGDELATMHGGRLVLVECHGAVEPDRERIRITPDPDTGKPVGRRVPSWACRRCGLIFWTEPTSPEDVLHTRALHEYEQAEALIGQVAEALGLDPWCRQATTARYNARQANASTVLGRAAAGLPALIEALIRQDAAAGAEIDALLAVQTERAEHPFFTEATLYDLLGKDDARTVLGAVRALARATGRSEP